jgi:Fe-S cluster assembly protein SufD
METWVPNDPDALAGSGVPWLDAIRRGALEDVRRDGIPTSHHEAWRYTSLKPLAEQGFSRQKALAREITRDDLTGILVPDFRAHRAVLVNGSFDPELSSLEALPAGVRAGSLRSVLRQDPDALAGHLNRLAVQNATPFSALNTAGLEEGFVLLVDAAARIEQPIEILHLAVGTDAPGLAQPRHLAVLGRGSRAQIVERYTSIGEPLYCTNSVLELVLGEEAVLSHDRIQTESPNAFHLTGLFLSQSTGSRYRGVNLGLGGAWSRTDLVVRFEGPHAQCDLQGLYLAGDKQLVDYHLDVDHRVPQCSSRERFKGILHGKGRAVFDGRIQVARDAQKTDAHLSNNNLLLSRSAEVDTKPQLEIFADDVKCSHGTTVGQIEPEALFYLRSRGLSEPMARRMLCLGFAGEIIDALGPEALRQQVADRVGQRLEQATAQ